MKNHKRFSLVLASLLLSFNAFADKVSDLLKQRERPSIEQLERISKNEMQSHYDSVELNNNLKTVFNLFIDVDKEIDDKFPDLDIFIFGRDAEPLFDAMWAMADKKKRKRLHLIQMSRTSIDSPSKNINKYLKEVGMDIEKVLTGKRRIVWLDTGSRGSIYVALFQHIIDSIKEDDPKRMEKIRNLITNIEPMLIVAWQSPTRDKILKELKSNDLSNEDIKSLLESDYYFFEIPESMKTRGKYGLTGGDWPQNRRIADLIEYTSKWHGTANSVSSSGDVKMSSGDGDNHFDKKGYLLRQWQIANYFSFKKSSSCSISVR